MVRLNDEEQAMLAGEFGEPRKLSMEHIQKVGNFFDAELSEQVDIINSFIKK